MKRGALLFACFALVAVLGGNWVLRVWVDRTELPDLDPDMSVVVEDRNGELLRAFTVADGRWRLPVTLDDVAPGYIAQLIAYEDKRFYSHSGVDFLAGVRALGQAVLQRKVVSGGSTLTMQVARLLEDSGTGRWQGKLRQIRLAWALEARLSKAEILKLYLHIAPYGGNIEGVRAATLSYFRKEPNRLTDAEAALLVALPQSPEIRRPDRYPSKARAARDRVLARSAKAEVIPTEIALTAGTEPVPTRRYPFAVVAPHLSERVVRTKPLQHRHRVTIDKAIQQQAERLLLSQVVKYGQAVSGAVMVVDHQTGEVLASVGSPAYLDTAREGFIDMTQAVRSPGSTLKPLIYGLAFDAGIAHPETVIDDRPVRFGDYAPQNFDNHFRGEISLRDALQASLNIPAVSLLDAIGPNMLMARMKRAGAFPVLPSNRPPRLAIGLGGIGLRLQDLMVIYAAIARGGEAVSLTTEMPLAANKQKTLPVLSPVSAWYVADILSDVPPPPGAIQDGIAYKTGTSYGHRDVWALGFDGRHTVGVWIGRPDGAAMPGALGNGVAAPLLFDVFTAIKPSLDPLPPAPGAALTVPQNQLPTNLQSFQKRGVLRSIADEPEITFPPNGAKIAVEEDFYLVAKVDRGQPPFTWLANGEPFLAGSYDRQVEMPRQGPGYLTITVIDSRGFSQDVAVTLER